MLITDQVATAPCTDPIQEGFPTFEAKLLMFLQSKEVFDYRGENLGKVQRVLLETFSAVARIGRECIFASGNFQHAGLAGVRFGLARSGSRQAVRLANQLSLEAFRHSVNTSVHRVSFSHDLLKYFLAD